jgi:hypothetical protein
VTFWSKTDFLKSGFKIFFSNVKYDDPQESECYDKNTKSPVTSGWGQSEAKVPKMAKFYCKKIIALLGIIFFI